MSTPRKLQPYQVLWARQMKKEGFRHVFVAKLLGISCSTLKNLLGYSTYKDVR
jgi:predicted transcriptional regulator